jgi:hypothetical protein
LGRALNANGFVQGTVMAPGGKLIATASVLDTDTLKILSSARL